MSAFGDILKALVDAVPGAYGAVFSDWEGEPVDQFGHVEPIDIQIAGAHWGVILSATSERLERACGHVEELTIEGERQVVLIRRVTDRYHVVLAARRDCNLGRARAELQRGADALLGEM